MPHPSRALRERVGLLISDLFHRVLRLSRPQSTKYRIPPQVLRKIPLIPREPGTNEMMGPRKAELFHLFSRLMRRPSFESHAVRRDHHSTPVISQAAVYENF